GVRGSIHAFDSWRLPLTRRCAPTSPRKRGEVQATPCTGIFAPHPRPIAVVFPSPPPHFEQHHLFPPNFPPHEKSITCPFTTPPCPLSCKSSAASQACSARPRRIARPRTSSPTCCSMRGFIRTCFRCRNRSSSFAISPPKVARG